MSVQMIPVGPGIPEGVRAILQSMQDAIRALEQPKAPMPLFVVDTAANLALRAPAEKYPGCFVQVTDKSCIAHSVEVAGVWTWLRADGTAL